MPRTHLRLTAPVAEDALLCEDPAAALALAQELLDAPRMSNHTLGLWGYHGALKSGAGELTVQAAGLAGAQAALVLAELAGHGVRRAIRIGACAGGGDPGLGGAVVAETALALDGASRELGCGPEVSADPALTAALAAADPALRPATVATSDLPPASAPAGAAVWDLSTAPLLGLGRREGIAVAAGLIVAEVGDAVLADAELETATLALGSAAAAALRAGRPASGPAAAPTARR